MLLRCAVDLDLDRVDLLLARYPGFTTYTHDIRCRLCKFTLFVVVCWLILPVCGTGGRCSAVVPTFTVSRLRLRSCRCGMPTVTDLRYIRSRGCPVGVSAVAVGACDGYAMPFTFWIPRDWIPVAKICGVTYATPPGVPIRSGYGSVRLHVTFRYIR